MATKTTNYNLTKPSGNENADIDVINANMDTIDSALSGKADKSEIPDVSGYATKTELSNGLNGKQDNITISDSLPSGGEEGDVWVVYGQESSGGTSGGGSGGSGGSRTLTIINDGATFDSVFTSCEVGGMMVFHEFDPSNEFPQNGYLYFTGTIFSKSSDSISLFGQGQFFKGNYGIISNSEVIRLVIDRITGDVFNTYEYTAHYIPRSGLTDNTVVSVAKILSGYESVTYYNGRNVMYLSP